MQVDRDAPLQFLRTAFLPDDWIAVLLKCQDTGEVVQRVGPVAMFLDDRFQGWLRFKNARGFGIFVSVNALTPGRRSRTRESIGTVRHVFLDADHGAGHLLSAIAARPDLPPPSYIVRSSKDRAHVLWRVRGFAIHDVEALQKHLARELGTDMAATSAVQLTRLPGFFNHKYNPPQFVHVDYAAVRPAHNIEQFPAALPSVEPPPVSSREPQQRGSMPMIERARRYLAATPPAIQGQSGDIRTFRVCCQLVCRFGLSDAEAMLVIDRWNARCSPPWSEGQLAAKIRNARVHGVRSSVHPSVVALTRTQPPG